MKKMSTVFLFIALFAFVTAIFPCVKLLQQNSQHKTEKSGYNSIIEVWQLDMIEGGTGSRKKLLDKIARKFEAKNEGVIVSVSLENQTSCEEKFKNGIYPDVISFSNGLEGFLDLAVPLKTDKKLAESFGGSYAGKNYAVAWAYGGYALFLKGQTQIDEVKNCFVAQGEYTLPLAAYYLSEYRFENLVVKKPLDAYAEFLSSKNCALIGTQRDLFRLSAKNVEYRAIPLDGYSDIIQYVSVLDCGKKNVENAKNFVEFLTSDGQNYIDEIGMLSPLYLGENSKLDELKPLYGLRFKETCPMFFSKERLSEIKNILTDKNVSEKEKLTTIKNIV